MCLAACQQARISRVVYGAKDPKGGALSLGYALHEDPRTNHRFPVEWIEDADCGGILTEFFRRRRKSE
jgi:tRNA(adenine34) deaminase